MVILLENAIQATSQNQTPFVWSVLVFWTPLINARLTPARYSLRQVPKDRTTVGVSQVY